MADRYKKSKAQVKSGNTCNRGCYCSRQLVNLKLTVSPDNNWMNKSLHIIVLAIPNIQHNNNKYIRYPNTHMLIEKYFAHTCIQKSVLSLLHPQARALH